MTAPRTTRLLPRLAPYEPRHRTDLEPLGDPAYEPRHEWLAISRTFDDDVARYAARQQIRQRMNRLRIEDAP